MGSIMVERMAEGAIDAEPKKLHPFFAGPRRKPRRNSKVSNTTHAAAQLTSASDSNDMQDKRVDEEAEVDVPEENGPRRKRQKKNDEVDNDWEDTKKPRRGRKKHAPQGSNIKNHFMPIKGDDQHEEEDRPDQLHMDQEDQQDSRAPTAALSQAPEFILNEDNTLPGDEMSDAISLGPIISQPKKLLCFNPKTGTIGSPPKSKEPKQSKEEVVEENTTPKPKRRTWAPQDEEPVKELKTPTPKGKACSSSRIAKISYGVDDESRKRIGSQINEVLSRSGTPSPRRKRTSPRKTWPKKPKATKETKSKTTAAGTAKATHPLFKKTKNVEVPTVIEASAKKSSLTMALGSREFSSTPCSPKKPRAAATITNIPQFGLKSLGLRVPGAKHPAFPWKDAVHVRGDTPGSLALSKDISISLNARKSKGNGVHIGQEEELMRIFILGLGIPTAINVVRNIDTEIFLPPPLELRLPPKHFESGVKLAKRVLRQLRTVTPPLSAQKCITTRPSGGSELEEYIETCNTPTPEVARLYSAMSTSLSALDQSQCETMCWAQKYTPTCAVEVLQSGKEAFLLRDWLQALKVQSVDTGGGDRDAANKKSKSKTKTGKGSPPRKKRKKNKLDGFVVDSDEEANEMDEVSDLEEENWSPNRRGAKKTVIRSGERKDLKHALRLTNAVVISGPHGCGKTSAVYAVAKELDFEIFEINSTTRRSGKDVLEKIGDMTRNHLVQHHQTEATPSANSIIDEEEVAEDIKSGKQATMNSFFEPKVAPKVIKKSVQKGLPSEQPYAKKALPKSQKQSLILLDEVDILYEEDKQFWTTVIGLMVQSKRPFIMTCNDENLVPLQTLNLHGIFRFSEPPLELAVDRLLMVAACEGHALRREAVEALYEARHHDLRACMMELNYWCQIGVGDRRGGFDWFVLRWPKGSDLDEEGKVVRVVSQDTYLEGMGWVAHDVLAKGTDPLWAEEELLQEAWNYRQLDVGNWHDSLDLDSWAQGLDDASLSPQERLASLERYDQFADAMGVADLCSSTAFAISIKEPVDCGLSKMPAKTQDDYIIGLQFLDAPIASSYDPMTTAVPISLKCLARRHLRGSMSTAASELDALDESKAIKSIRKHTIQSPASLGITRHDFSLAFDPLAVSEKSTSNGLDLSAFDGRMDAMVVDVAPYVRSIVSYDNELQKQRLRRSNLLSAGGKPKRMRNTRASHAALEGGSRSTTRPDRWFKAELNSYLVVRTAGEGWTEAVEQEQDSCDGTSKDRSKGRKVVSDDSADELAGDSPQRGTIVDSDD